MSISRRLLELISYPFRLAVRYELTKVFNNDIKLALQREATVSSARYVKEKMQAVPSCSSKMAVLSLALDQVEKHGEGLFLEFGVYSGATINFIARQAPDRQIFGFDSFEGLPEFWRDGFAAGRFNRKKLPKTRKNVILITGWFEDTLPSFLQSHPQTVDFLHIDCDLYSSTKTIFDNLHRNQRLKPGAVIVFDEYFNYPGWENGEYKAFQEFIQSSGLGYRYLTYNHRDEQAAVQLTEPQS
ncbi:MAG: hypothetical protein Kow0037_29700 [Calditrichia bacterium]